MKLADIRNLIFPLFQADTLVRAATGWSADDIENNATASYPSFSNTMLDDVPFFDQYETDAVEAVFHALIGLSQDSISLKLKSSSFPKLLGRSLVPTEMSFHDYSFWARKTYWLPAEAVLISLGFRPEDKLIQLFDQLDNRSFKMCRLLNEYYERLELLYAENRSGRLTQESDPPEILEWFEKQEFSLPEGLVAATRRFQCEEIRASAPSPENYLSNRERETLLRLVAAMAVRGYSFNPNAARNPATKDIQDDLDHLGIGLDQKTILKWLREATDILDPENIEGS